MPHITVEMWPGRPEEVKAKLAEDLAEAMHASMGVGKEHISVSIREVAKENWNENVVERELADEACCFIKPHKV